MIVKNLLLLLVALFTIFQTVSFTQESDSIEVKIRERHKQKVHPGKNDWKIIAFRGGNPSIDIAYGISDYSIKNFKTDFNKSGLLSIRLGHTFTGIDSSKALLDYSSNFIGFNLIDNNYQNEDIDNQKIEIKDWQVSLGSVSGYGYKIGKSAIVPYTSNSFLWQETDLQIPVGAGITPLELLTNEYQSEKAQLERINDGIRFGTKTQGGIRFQIVPLFTIDAGYERAQIFPRHLFWKQSGSMLIEAAAQGALDAFINEIKDNTPAATPIINFLLKNALSYGIYELRRSDMSWPFSTEEPVCMDSYKIGLTFVF